MRAAVAAAILEGAGVTSVQIVPLVSKSKVAGAMVLAAHDTEAGAEESVAFARAMGNQLVHYLELGQSFAQLTASEQRYRTLMESANDGITLLGTDGVIREVNLRMAEMLGRPAQDIVGRHIRDFAPPGQAGGNDATFAGHRRGRLGAQRARGAAPPRRQHHPHRVLDDPPRARRRAPRLHRRARRDRAGQGAGDSS